MERKEHEYLEQHKDLEQTTDILCDVCMESTQLNCEPYRVCRRVNILRDYPDDKIKIYP